MKKKYLWMVMLMALPLVFTACGSDDDNDNGNSTTTPTQNSQLKTPKNANDAISFEVTDPTNDLGIHSVTLTESGNYVVKKYKQNQVLAVATRANEGIIGYEYVIGTYTVAGNTYTLTNFGTITIQGKGSTSPTAVIRLQGGAEADLAIKGSNGVVASSLNADLCREWKIQMTTISANVSGLTVGTQLNGALNLGRVKEILASHGIVAEGIDDVIVNNIEFTNDGDYILKYSGRSNDIGRWNWSNPGKTIAYTWDDPDNMGNALFTGAADVEITDGVLTLTFKANIESGGTVYQVTMKSRLIDANQ